ncbi:hypothetical protein AYL99_11728 [Fonsecaea erecta]|uniref:Uncharacterized protein n=1 Tax=Fonsecaea erecta TaxID=1367422 RepID=A0A178Z4S9_9EURO|nr:hypothetical protein AYL99_11728 [Fonsecaea erecta]OAP54193.1 hypothetical protein AYL99_11728 [Fonsecaea erecta]
MYRVLYRRIWRIRSAKFARLIPPEGMTIGGTYIPGNVNVLAPSYPLFRPPECYEYPDEFIPERWYGKPEFLKRSDALLRAHHAAADEGFVEGGGRELLVDIVLNRWAAGRVDGRTVDQQLPRNVTRADGVSRRAQSLMDYSV